MIGIFDSGVGGLTVLEELRRLSPEADVCFFADRENAPYGTKTKDEVISLVRRNIALLTGVGADKILMACCTASTVHRYLTEREQSLTIPIIAPTARAAVSTTRCGKVGVIATERTALSGAFAAEIHALDTAVRVFEWQAQALVGLTEGGVSDAHYEQKDLKIIENLLSPIKDTDVDTLILGCTHFPRISGLISRVLPGVRLISSAYEGAAEAVKIADTSGSGLTIYL